MATTNPYCDPEDLVRNAQACATEEGAGIYHVALVRKGTTISKTSPTAYMQSILDAEKACNAFILRNTYGTYDGGTAQFGKSYGGGTPRRIGSEHTLTVADPQYVGNETFWNAFIYQSNQFDVYFFTQTRVWAITGKALVVDPKGAIVEDFKEIIEGQIAIKWNDKNNPVSEEINMDGIAVYPSLAAGTVVSNGDETYNATNHTITVSKVTELDVLIPFTSAVTHSIPDAAELSALEDAGATVADTGAGLRINAATNALTEGTYAFTVKGANSCGIAGTQAFTLVVTA